MAEFDTCQDIKEINKHQKNSPSKSCTLRKRCSNAPYSIGTSFWDAYTKMIYFIPLLLLLLGIYKFDTKRTNKKTKQYKLLEYVICCFLIFIPGLSYRIGVDTPSYMANYSEIKPLYETSFQYLFESEKELLWTLFGVICKTISSDFAFMHTIQCFIVTYCILYFGRQFTNKTFIYLLFYYSIIWVHMCFETLRESLAFSLYLIALSKLLKKENYKEYFLWAIPALFFHRFSFIIIALTPIYFYFKNKQKIIICITVLFSLLFIINSEYIFILFLGDYFANNERIQYYMLLTTTGEMKMSIIGILSYVIELALPSFLMIRISSYLYKKGHEASNKGYISLLLLVIMIGIIAAYIDTFRRVYYYMLPFVAITFIQMFSRLKFSPQRQLNLQNRIMYIGLFVIFTYSIVFSGINFCKPTVIESRTNVTYNSFYFPYYSIFTKKTDSTREMIHRY